MGAMRGLDTWKSTWEIKKLCELWQNITAMSSLRVVCTLHTHRFLLLSEQGTDQFGMFVWMALSQTGRQSAEWVYVASSLDLTYSPAVTTGYLAGVPGDTQVGIGYWSVTSQMSICQFVYLISMIHWPREERHNLIQRRVGSSGVRVRNGW